MSNLFGLIGTPLTHSFSQEYFTHKFQTEGLTNYQYRLFPLKKISELKILIANYPHLKGLNVTIPYKKLVVPFLDQLSREASDTEAVNCIKIESRSGKPFLVGYNTDIFGFEQSLKPILKSWHKKAIIIGTGGSASAVAFVLKSLKVAFCFVSRNPSGMNQVAYGSLSKDLMREHLLIINATPLGMFPDINQCPDIPYDQITKRHLLFDLIYNPEETLFLKKGKEMGAMVKNGIQMLHFQAEKSWEIWQD
jgi:shikimate dehydrogenase